MANSAVVGTLRAILAADTAEFATAMKKAGDVADQTARDMTKASASFEAAGGRMASVTRLIKDFNGSLERRTAEEFALAIEKIGGAARLSENELRRAQGVFSDYISKAEAMGQEVPAHLQKVSNEISKLSGVSTKSVGVIGDIKSAFSNLGPSILASAGGFATALISVEALTRGLRAAFDFIKDSISTYAEAEKAQRKMVAALEAQNQATPKTIASYKALANQFQETTVFQDDLIMEMETLLTQVGGVMPNEMEKALTAVTNLASGLGIDLRSATLMVAKAAEDNFAALQKQGVQIDVTKAKAEGFDYVLGRINAKFGGQAAADLQTFDGQLKQTANQFDELKETIGEVIVNSTAFQVAFALLRVELAKIDAELKFVFNSMKLFAAMPGPIGDAFRLAFGEMKNATASADELASTLANSYVNAQKLAAKNTRDFVKELSAAQQEIKNLSKADKEQIDAMLKAGKSWDDLPPRIHLSAEAQKIYASFTKESTKATKDNKKVVDEAAKAYRDWADEITGAKLLEKLGTLETRLAKLRQETTPSARALKAIAIEAEKLGQELGFLPPDLQSLVNQFVGLNKGIVATSLSLPIFSDRLALSGEEIRAAKAEVDGLLKKLDDFNKIVNTSKGLQDLFKGGVSGEDIKKAQEQIKTFGQKSIEAISTLGQAFRGLGHIIGGTAGQILDDIGSIAEGITRLAQGDIVGGLLQIGATVGKHLKTLGRNIARDMQDAFATSELGFQNLAALNEELKRLGAVDLVNRGDRAQRKDDEAATRKWMDDVRKFLAESDQAAAALATRLAGAFDELASAASEFGGKAPAALQPFIDELLKMTGLTDEQRMLLQGLAGAPEWKQLQDIAQKYGIELGALGQKFQEGRIGDTALQYARDFMTLRDAGGDVNGILQGMQDEVQALVTDSLKFGIALPEALRDVVQGLIDMGQLTDENGDALTDLSRINFKGTLEDAFVDIKNILEEIRDLLAGGLPKAAEDGARGIEGAFKAMPKIRVPVDFDWGDLRPPDGFSVPGGLTPMASGGITTRMTPALLHPNEAVIPLDEGFGRPIQLHAELFLDGRKVTETVLTHTREVARRIGVRPI